MTEWSEVNRNRYSEAAALYHRTRPSCPVDLVERLVQHAGVRPGDPVAEIGAGTGLFTRLLSGRGLVITALEPVDGMRAQADALSDVTRTAGTFERTGLPDASQRWVVSCQAFQWADRAAALPELRRILRPEAWFTALWYTHDLTRSPVLRRTFGLLRQRTLAYSYVDRAAPARRLASRVLGALPERLQRGLGRVASLRSDRGSRGLQLLRPADFGKLAYHEARLTASVDREGIWICGAAATGSWRWVRRDSSKASSQNFLTTWSGIA
jgi:SAM-dependent methyltransferase